MDGGSWWRCRALRRWQSLTCKHCKLLARSTYPQRRTKSSSLPRTMWLMSPARKAARLPRLAFPIGQSRSSSMPVIELTGSVGHLQEACVENKVSCTAVPGCVGCDSELPGQEEDSDPR